MSKIGEIGKKLEKSDFLQKMVLNALGTPRNTFKSQQFVKKKKKKKSAKSEKKYEKPDFFRLG